MRQESILGDVGRPAGDLGEQRLRRQALRLHVVPVGGRQGADACRDEVSRAALFQQRRACFGGLLHFLLQLGQTLVGFGHGLLRGVSLLVHAGDLLVFLELRLRLLDPRRQLLQGLLMCCVALGVGMPGGDELLGLVHARLGGLELDHQRLHFRLGELLVALLLGKRLSRCGKFLEIGLHSRHFFPGLLDGRRLLPRLGVALELRELGSRCVDPLRELGELLGGGLGRLGAVLLHFQVFGGDE
mmetsp:Transcript_91936/g.265203  ORF Transcript_91936/g.265203 Transcript_91936/m.265203 type:complete len:243 (+) Transcript_91936:2657-3385(+)